MKDLKPHEIEFNEAIRSVDLALNSMKTHGGRFTRLYVSPNTDALNQGGTYTI